MVLLAAHVGYWCVLGMGCEPLKGARSEVGCCYIYLLKTKWSSDASAPLALGLDP